MNFNYFTFFEVFFADLRIDVKKAIGLMVLMLPKEKTVMSIKFVKGAGHQIILLLMKILLVEITMKSPCEQNLHLYEQLLRR